MPEATASNVPQPARVACPSCDRLYDVGNLADGETARCARCSHVLTTYRADELDRVLAYAIAGLVLLALACGFPFMEFRASGLESVMTLPQTALALWRHGMPDLAFLVGAFIILIPALVLLLVVVLVGALRQGRRRAWLPGVGRLVFKLQSWSMVEVFFIGVLVSLVKIAGMATVVLGTSFWAYAGFSVLFTLALVTLDRYQCWRRIESLGPP